MGAYQRHLLPTATVNHVTSREDVTSSTHAGIEVQGLTLPDQRARSCCGTLYPVLDSE
jgi:hypothetical protein